jgi:hypothetical protein
MQDAKFMPQIPQNDGEKPREMENKGNKDKWN